MILEKMPLFANARLMREHQSSPKIKSPRWRKNLPWRLRIGTLPEISMHAILQKAKG